MHARRSFNSIAERLLHEDGSPGDQQQAANDLYAFFNELAGCPQDASGAEATPWQRETLLPSGKAINPYSAATCLLDYRRTRAFARGVHQAIRAAQERFPGKTIDLLYAGTGPFAPLALLQTAFFASQEVRFTLIDIHRPALTCLGEVVSKLGLEEYVAGIYQADATQWVPPQLGTTYQVVVTEVMERALTQEPQVAVTMNLARYLRSGGFFVPQSVDLTLCLLDPTTEFELIEEGGEGLSTFRRERVMVATLFTLSGAKAGELAVTDKARIPLPDIHLPTRLPPGYAPYILTKINTFGDICLDEYDSGLTHPHAPQDLVDLTPSTRLESWYAMGRHPGLQLIPVDEPRAGATGTPTA